MTDFGDSPYAVLEVTRGADAASIEAAYHRLQNLLADGSLASYGMLEEVDIGQLRHQLDWAYALLSDAKRRASFDKTGRIELDAGGPAPRVSPQPAEAKADAGPRAAQKKNRASSAKNLHATMRTASAAPTARRPTAVSVDLPAAAQVAPAPRIDAKLAHPVRPSPIPGRPALNVPLLAQVPAEARFDGQLLRALRESAQVSIEELSEWTKIGRRYLIAIESDDFALLPAKVYVRGFVGQIARVFGFDVARVTRSYLEAYSAWAADD